MATTVDARVIAGTLYESLIGTAVDQLRTAAPSLSKKGVQGDIIARVDAALPANALPQVRNFLLSLGNEGLLDQVGAIADAFADFASTIPAAPLDAAVTSAVPLTPTQQEAILADLRQRYGAGVTVDFTVDPSLIGGLIIRVGDQVLDNSLRTRMSALQRNMLAS